jgi:hypothetical protein
VDIELVTYFEIIVSRGLPNAPLSVDGQPLACLDDRGDFSGMIEGVWLEDCEVVIDDTVKFITAPVEDCVAWRDTYVPSLVGADLLHQEGVTGEGVSIAVVDTGLNATSGWGESAYQTVARYNVFNGEASGGDGSGHGSHVSSVAASHGVTAEGDYNGIAPGAGLVGVKAFDGGGQGTYADVIAGIEWVVANKDLYNIRVLNLSFSAAPQSFYWEDPLNQAVMAARSDDGGGAGTGALRHHRRRHDRQLHAGRRHRRQSGFLLLGRTHL